MRDKFSIYHGDIFAIEWYFDKNGKCPALEYFKNLQPDQRRKALRLFTTLADAGKIFNIEKFLSEGDKIFAFKPSPDRFLCFFFDGAKVIITNAYEKRTEKMPPIEKERALKALSDYTKRCKEGTYYED